MDRTEAYSVLELDNGATLEEIDRAYRDLARVWHPDRFPNSPDLRQKANKKLQRINEAYRVLKAGRADEHSREDRAGDTPPVYQDDDCHYLGHDARLGRIRDWEFGGRHAAVQVTEDGITLVTFRSGRAENGIRYPAQSILWIHSGRRAWGRPGALRSGRIQFPTVPQQVTFYASDPEGIIEGFHVTLKFRNNYFADLFTKKVRETFSLEPPPKPKPKPKPKPAPSPSLKTPESQERADSILLVCGTVAALLISLVILAAGTRWGAGSKRGQTNHHSDDAPVDVLKATASRQLDARDTPRNAKQVEEPEKRNGAASDARAQGGDLEARETSFFGIPEKANRLVYVLDTSGSLDAPNAFDIVKSELLSSLKTLKSKQVFHVVLAADRRDPSPPSGLIRKAPYGFDELPSVEQNLRGQSRGGLYRATSANLSIARQFVKRMRRFEYGRTHRRSALEVALQMDPDAIYFLTYAGAPRVSRDAVNEITRLNNGRARIHCIELGQGERSRKGYAAMHPILAGENDGTFHYHRTERWSGGNDSR